MANAHLVKLSGMGDHQWTLLNDTAWTYLEACCDWQHGTPKPVAPDAIVQDYIEANPGTTHEEAVGYLTLDEGSSSADNDVAMSMEASTFNGEKYSSYEPDISALNAFIAKHNLTLHESYEGYLY